MIAPSMVNSHQAVIIHAGGIGWQQRYSKALLKGLLHCGFNVSITSSENVSSLGEVTHILLGPNLWTRAEKQLINERRDYLTVNRAFLGSVLGDQEDPYVAIGWNGYNNDAVFAFDYGDALPHSRMKEEYLYPLRPWTDDERRPALILLEYQTPKPWLDAVLGQLLDAGKPYIHRCHPNGISTELGGSINNRTLAQDAAIASVALTHHTTAAVEVMLRGVPVVSYNEASMCWPVTGHRLDEVKKVDRIGWMEWLAWTQWSLSEIAAGEPWQWL